MRKRVEMKVGATYASLIGAEILQIVIQDEVFDTLLLGSLSFLLISHCDSKLRIRGHLNVFRLVLESVRR